MLTEHEIQELAHNFNDGAAVGGFLVGARMANECAAQEIAELLAEKERYYAELDIALGDNIFLRAVMRDCAKLIDRLFPLDQQTATQIRDDLLDAISGDIGHNPQAIENGILKDENERLRKALSDSAFMCVPFLTSNPAEQ